MSNPYQAPEISVNPSAASGPVRKVAIRPWARLGEVKQMLGDNYWMFVGICLVAILVGSMFAIILMGPMMCGMFYCYFQREKGPVTFDMVFKGFDYFLESFVAMLIMTGVMFVIELPFGILWMVIFVGSMAANDGEPPVAIFGVLPVIYVLLMALILAVQVPFSFVFPLIVDRRMKAVEAIKLSWQGAKMNFMGLYGMYLLHMVIALAASCACYFPVFFLLPLFVGCNYQLYREIFPIDPKAAVAEQSPAAPA